MNTSKWLLAKIGGYPLVKQFSKYFWKPNGFISRHMFKAEGTVICSAPYPYYEERIQAKCIPPALCTRSFQQVDRTFSTSSNTKHDDDYDDRRSGQKSQNLNISRHIPSIVFGLLGVTILLYQVRNNTTTVHAAKPKKRVDGMHIGHTTKENVIKDNGDGKIITAEETKNLSLLKPSATVLIDIDDCIDGLQDSNLGRKVKTLGNCNNFRIDKQGEFKRAINGIDTEFENIQVQSESGDSFAMVGCQADIAHDSLPEIKEGLKYSLRNKQNVFIKKKIIK